MIALRVREASVRAPGRGSGRGPGRGSGRSGAVILGPVSLQLERGEHVLLVGSSGSGKTTLLRAIAGLDALAGGSIEIDGRLASDGPRRLLAPAERGVGLLFQGGALWPHMSVERTLRFVLRGRGVPRARRAARIAELLELVDLADFAKRRPGTLSGGEAQRLGLARALAAGARLLLLDEPLGPLDAPRRRELLERLKGIHDSLGLTVLHVTHDPGEASHLADRTLVLEGGRLL